MNVVVKFKNIRPRWAKYIIKNKEKYKEEYQKRLEKHLIEVVKEGNP